MFRRIVTYLVCWSIAFHPVAVQATNTEVTVLLANKAYAAQIGDKPVNCLDVKKGKSGQVHVAFDQSLHQENSSYVLVLERQPIGQVFFEKGQLNFWGYQNHVFSLEAQEGYVYPLFCAQAVGDLFLKGGQFTKDSVFIAENLATSGIYKSTCALTFQARKNLNVQGQYATVQLNMQALKLLLDAVAETTDIQAEAQIIEEAPTSKLYAANNIVVNGYQQGFSHKGLLKAKSAIVLNGDAYTGHTGSQTVAGSMFNNQSKTIDESGRVVAGLGYMQGTNLSLKDGFTFTGYHFVAEGADDLTLDPKVMIQVQYGAQLDSKKKLIHKGILSQVGVATINFPYMEMFGLESCRPASVKEWRQRVSEIQAIQAKTLPNVDLKGISLKSSQDMEITGLLMTPNNSITVKTPNLLFQGVSQSGFFEGLNTIIQSKSAIVEGVIRAQSLIALIDQYIKLNGLMVAKYREIVFTPEEGNAQAAAQDQKPKVVEMGAEAKLLEGSLSIKHADSANLDAGIATLTTLYINAKETVQKADNKLTVEQLAGFTGEFVTLGGSLQAKDLVATPTKEVTIEKTGEANASGTAQYKTQKMTVTGQAKAGVSVTEVEKLNIPVGGELQGNTNIVDAKDATADGNISGGVVQATFNTVTQGAQGSIKATEQATINVEKEGTFGGKSDAPSMNLQGEKATVAKTGAVTGKEVRVDLIQLTEEHGAVVAGSDLTDIKSVDATLNGETGSTVTNIDVENKLETGKDSNTKGTVQLVTNAKEWDHKGKTEAGHYFSKTEHTKIAPGAEVNSTLSTQMQATKEFDNAGVVASKGAAHLKTPTDKVGLVTTENGLTLEPEQRPDWKGIFAGKHNNLNNNSAVTVIVKYPVTITESPKAPYKAGLVAPIININVPLICQRGIFLESTHKGIDLSHDIRVNGTARIKAPYITVPRGKTMSADVLYAEATAGNILNRGTMRGSKYLERRAAGDVVDEGYWSTKRNGKLSIPVWTPALAIGGTGISIKIGDKLCNMGLMSIAGGMIRNIGSHVSTGAGADAYLDATYGIENLSQAQRYLVASWTKRHGLLRSSKTHYEQWSETVFAATEFFGGRVFRSSERGGFYNSGSTHAGHGEDVTNVDGPITHAAVVSNDTIHISKKRFCGACKSSRQQNTQQAQVVRFFNNSGIYHTSRTAGISGQGPLFVAPVMVLYAPNQRIHFDEVVLNNSIHTRSSALSPTISGIALFSSAGFDAMPGVSLYNDLRGMGQSDADIGRMVAGLQQTWSQITGLANGYNNGKTLQQIGAQFGELGFSFTSSKSTQKWQTSMPTMIHVGVGHFISGHGADLFGGAQVNFSESFTFDIPELLLAASSLKSSSKSKSFNCGAGYNPWTYTGSVNFGMNKASSHGVSHQYAQLNGPQVYLGVMEHLGLHGGAINCNKIHGKVGRVDVVTLQDEFHSKQSGFSVNLSSNFMSGISNPSGGFSFNVGSSHMKQVNPHAGIFAAAGFDDSFSIGHLNVTDTELDPLLAAQAKHVNYTKIFDVKESHSFGIGMQGQDFSSAETFAQSFGKNAAVLAAGAAATEIGKAAGMNNQVATAMAMVAGALVSNEINESRGKNARAPESGIGALGHLNYSVGDHKVNVTGIDFSLKNLKQAYESLGLAAEKFLAPEPVEGLVLVIPVIQVQGPVTEPETLDELPDDEDRPALRMKTPEDKVDVEDKAAEEKLAERKKKAATQKAAAKKQASDKGKEEADADDALPPLGHFSLPKAARAFIENAPLILEDNAEQTAETRVERRLGGKSATAQRLERGIILASEGIEQARQAIMAPDLSWVDRLYFYTCSYGNEKSANDLSRNLAPTHFVRYVPPMVHDGYKLLSAYARGEKTDQDVVEDFLYSGKNVGMALVTLSSGTLIKGLGKKAVTGTTIVFRKIIDIRNRNTGSGVTGFLDNPKAGIWNSATYSADYAIHQDPRYDAAKQKWTVDPSAPFNVFTHGNANVVLVRTPGGMKPVKAKGFSKILANNPDYIAGTPIHMFVCNTGKTADGFAQQLANRMNVPVFAPTEKMIILRSNKIAIGSTKQVNGHEVMDPKALGESRMFVPQRGRPINDNQDGKTSKLSFLNLARNLLRDDVGAGKSPFDGNGPSKKALKTFAKMKNSPASDWTVDDLAKVGNGFGVEVKHGGKHVLLKYPDGTQFGLSYGGMIVDKGLVKKFVRKIEALEIPNKGRSLLKDDSGAVWIPSKRELKGYGATVKNTVLNKLHEYQYKKHGWVPLVDKPRDGKWGEVTVDKVVFLNEVDVRLDNLSKKPNPKGPFTVVWEGARRLSPEVGTDSGWSIDPILFEQYLYTKGYKNGQPIAFVSCNSAESAREVAEYMRVPVLGFDGFVRPHRDGGFKLLGRYSKRQLGYMETYYPQPSYQKALMGAAGMAAGLAPVFILTRDTQLEDTDVDDFADPFIEGMEEKSMPFAHMH